MSSIEELILQNLQVVDSEGIQFWEDQDRGRLA